MVVSKFINFSSVSETNNSVTPKPKPHKPGALTKLHPKVPKMLTCGFSFGVQILLVSVWESVIGVTIFKIWVSADGRPSHRWNENCGT
jgi:hypothetical protein